MIPESQLERWANQGATVSAQNTYASVKAALDAHTWPEGIKFTVYLQGSYRNWTNIRGDSDVDVVTEMTSVVKLDTSALDSATAAKVTGNYRDSDYGFEEFRTDVEKALNNYYGWLSVENAPKCFKVKAGSGRLAADVVPCMKLVKYKTETRKVEGMTFKPRGLWTPWIQNFPKLHYDEGADKNGDRRTAGWYKPTVRMFKNARNKINSDRIFPLRAPSYFLESLLHNVPDTLMEDTHKSSFSQSMFYLSKALDDNLAFYCQNQEQLLFGDLPEQWSRDEAIAFIKAVVKLWEDWYDDASVLAGF